MLVKTCRCCCATISLEKAAKAIGIIFTILASLSVVTWAVKLYQFEATHDKIKLQLGDLTQYEGIQHQLAQSRNLLVGRLCSEILSTVFSALLVTGVNRRNKYLVLSFVVFFVLYTAGNTIFNLYLFYDSSIFIGQATIDQLQKPTVDIIKAIIYTVLAIGLVINAFYWYLAIVVYSYYKEMVRSGPTHVDQAGVGPTLEHSLKC